MASVSMEMSTKVSPAKGGVVNGLRLKGQSRKSGHKKSVLRVCRNGTAKELSALIKDTDLVNSRFKGTTPLHEACSYGNLECVKVLMKEGADPTIWDVRGFTQAHCSVYNNHLSCLQVLLDFRPPANASWRLHTNTPSQYGESLLHIACLRGNLQLAQFLLSREADVTAVDRLGNTVLHYAASSNDWELMKWIARLIRDEVEGSKVTLDTQNQYGQTAAHRACLLGCPASLNALARYHANLSIQDKAGYTPVDLAKLLGNRECYTIGRKPVPPSPPSTRNSFSDNLSSSHQSLSLSQSGRFFIPQRSLSNGSNSTPPLQRQPSITGGQRPHNLAFRRASKGSLSSMQDDSKMYITKETALQVGSSFRHKKSRSWDNTHQVLYNSTAYKPPPDILFVPPVETATLTRDDSRFFCEQHDIKIKVSPELLIPKSQPSDPGKLDPQPPGPSIEVCVAAAMHLNQPFPSAYTIVSPVYFISCRSSQHGVAEVTLPHATDFNKERLCILSTTTLTSTLQPEVWSPSDRTLSRLDAELSEADVHRVKFRTSLEHPSLYAVAVNERDFSLEPHLPLKCMLFVSYPDLPPTASVSGLYVTAYVGMNLKTVHTAVVSQTEKDGSILKQKNFTLPGTGEGLRVDARLTNQPDEWIMTSEDSGVFSYNQLALTQETDKDSLSHLPAYPPHTKFFVEPRGVAAAVKCQVRVVSADGNEICFLKVFPFSPSRVLTPPPSQPVSEPSSASELQPLTSQPSHLLATTV